MKDFKKTVEAIKDMAVKTRQELVTEWTAETNNRRLDELMADAKRMAIIEGKMNEILKRKEVKKEEQKQNEEPLKKEK